MVLTDSEFDEILHDCLILASAKEFEAIPNVEPEFTRSEARQIEKMLAAGRKAINLSQMQV